jgi:hypothetical protein
MLPKCEPTTSGSVFRRMASRSGQVSACSKRRCDACDGGDCGIKGKGAWVATAAVERSRVVSRWTRLCLPMTVSGFMPRRGSVTTRRVLEDAGGGTNRRALVRWLCSRPAPSAGFHRYVCVKSSSLKSAAGRAGLVCRSPLRRYQARATRNCPQFTPVVSLAAPPKNGRGSGSKADDGQASACDTVSNVCGT